jgi:hypothetical protein
MALKKRKGFLENGKPILLGTFQGYLLGIKVIFLPIWLQVLIAITPKISCGFWIKLSHFGHGWRNHFS